jgi:hypothetical protein
VGGAVPDIRVPTGELPKRSEQKKLASTVEEAFRGLDPIRRAFEVNCADITWYFADVSARDQALIDSTLDAIRKVQLRTLGRKETPIPPRCPLDVDQAAARAALRLLGEKLDQAPSPTLVEMFPQDSDSRATVLKDIAHGLCALLQSLGLSTAEHQRAFQECGDNPEALAHQVNALQRKLKGMSLGPWVPVPQLTQAFAEFVRATAKDLSTEPSVPNLLHVWQMWKALSALARACACLTKALPKGEGPSLRSLIPFMAELNLATGAMMLKLAQYQEVCTRAEQVDREVPDLGLDVDLRSLAKVLTDDLASFRRAVNGLVMDLRGLFSPGASPDDPPYRTT